MKLTRNVLFGLVMAGTIVFLSGVSFAQMAPTAGKDSSARTVRHEAKIKLLQDSATALQQTNPNLAMKLNDLVNEETNESKEKLAKDSPEWKAKHDARIQLFQQAASALQQSHPDLAKSLEEMTVLKQKTEIQK